MNSNNRLKRIIAVVAIAAAAVTMSGCAQGASQTSNSSTPVPTIKFGYIGDFNGTYALAVADKLGLWSKYGVKVDPKVFTNGPLQIQAMQTGDIDTGSIGPGALWMAAAGQAKVISINGLGLADRVVALPGKGITSIEDLRGKKVGVPQGTSGDMILQLALKKAHMTEADIQPVNMDPSTTVSALSAGQIDAAALWYPLLDTVKKAQPKLIELASDKDFYPKNTFPGTIVASNSFASSQKPALIKLLKVLQAANDYWLTHKEQTIKLTAAYLKIPEETVKSNAENIMYPTTAKLVAQSKDGTSAKWLSDLATIFVGMGKLDKPKDIKEWYLSDLWPEAAATK